MTGLFFTLALSEQHFEPFKQDLKDDRHAEYQIIKLLPIKIQSVMNAAHYVLADMNKEET
ncbi:MAG: hypothetical protein M0Q90_09445 [Bacteroidales bacterium]|nr:hypothetical protein [Bacteroidales bacterium]